MLESQWQKVLSHRDRVRRGYFNQEQVVAKMESDVLHSG